MERDDSVHGSSFDARVVRDSPRLQRRRIPHSRADGRSRPKLPDAFEASSIYKSDSAIPTRKPLSERIKKMVEDQESLDERHRRLVERLSHKMKKKINQPEPKSDTTVCQQKTKVKPMHSGRVQDEVTPVKESEVIPATTKEKSIPVVKVEEEDVPRLAMEFDEPPIPTIRRRPPARSNLVAMFAADPKQSPAPLTKNAEKENKPPIGEPPISPVNALSVATAAKPASLESAPLAALDNGEEINGKSPTPEPSMFTKLIAACIVVCAVSIVAYFMIM